MKTFRKQPADVLDYDIDLSDWIEAGDSIQSIAITAPTGITVDSTSIASPRVKIWISGGTDGETYKLSPRITTTSRVLEVDFLVIVIDQ